MTSCRWSVKGLTYRNLPRGYTTIHSDGRSFIINVSDIDGNVSFSVKSWGAIVGDFDTDGYRLMLFIVKVSIIFDFNFTIVGDLKDT